MEGSLDIGIGRCGCREGGERGVTVGFDRTLRFGELAA